MTKKLVELERIEEKIECLSEENELLKQHLQRRCGTMQEEIECLSEEKEELKQQNQQYKALLQDMGLLMSDKEVIDIRNNIADKLIKPLLKKNGFDVDIDTTNGLTIIPKKGDVE